LLPARFASNKKEYQEKDSPKKRVFKHGRSAEDPNHQKLGNLNTATEELDFCLWPNGLCRQLLHNSFHCWFKKICCSETQTDFEELQGLL
jgi:hypothetical protein